MSSQGPRCEAHLVEEVGSDIFRIEVPLPGSPSRAVNCYLVRTAGRSLLIDTGMCRPASLDAVQAGLTRVGVSIGNLDFFITHHHPDHVGLVAELARQGARVYLSELDAHELHDPDPWTTFARKARMNGFSEDDLGRILSGVIDDRPPGLSTLTFDLIRDGDVIPCGPYVFTCIWTPGHTQGHSCLYEARSRILFSGDHVLGGLTPNISGWTYEGDALQQYFDSLDKVTSHEIDRVFPGHGEPFRNPKRRSSQIKKHHLSRASEVLSILASGRQTAFEVALRMRWGNHDPNWDALPALHKWFAGGEALAHLHYLVGTGQAQRDLRKDLFWFSLG